MSKLTFSHKQLRVLGWWCDTSPHKEKDAIICDGAVRSGKTLSLSLSFALWALCAVGRGELAICGKTIPSLRRNLIRPLVEALVGMGIPCRLLSSRNRLEIGQGFPIGFSLFGGRDEGSAALIQGATFSGLLLDEVALMPRSFVEQAVARCSKEEAKLFFSCNPAYPQHWFYREWILGREEKNALYLRFEMTDNPSLSPKVLSRYKRIYSGPFYERYVLGRWAAARGLVYPMFSKTRHLRADIPRCSRFVVSCDYGTVNPASFGLWGYAEGAWYRLREFYHDSRREGRVLTDAQYADLLEQFVGLCEVEAILVDPSAASFIACLRERGLPARAARNDVGNGIRTVAAALGEGRVFFHTLCHDTIREFGLYRWDDRAEGDVPCKRDDHAMDDLRYFALEYLTPSGRGNGLWVGSVARKGGRP